MNQPTEPPRRPWDPPPPALGYRARAEDKQPRPMPYVRGAFLGLGLYVLTGLIWLGLMQNGLLRRPLVPIGAGLLAALLTFTIFAEVRWRWRGVVVGVLLGLGLTLLLVGLCFAAFSRGFRGPGG